jgi:anti-sigma regulatory factor (Ser/Thr protein kinase)
MGRVLVIGRTHALSDELRAVNALRPHEIDRCGGTIEALQLVRAREVDVVVTDSDTSIGENLACSKELSALRPGIRTILLAPEATDQEVIAALRAQVFACFTAPFDRHAIADMVVAALDASEWRNGIEVVSGLPHWLTLRVACRRLTAERLVAFMTELQDSLPDDERHLLIAAFRELLLNAMEHGAGFNAEKVVEVTAAKTARAIVYHFRDPGSGFDPDDLKHAANAPTAEQIVSSATHRSEQGLRAGGFGMLIARSVADELVYNERRNEVLLIKHLS